jgi:glutaredoxin
MYKDMTAIIYSKEGCKHCKLIEEVMNLTNIDYVVYTLDEHFDRQQFNSEFGDATFPRVVIDGELIGGAKEAIEFLKTKQLC